MLPSPEADGRADQDKKDRDAKRKSDDDLVKFTGQLAEYTKDLAHYTGALIIIGIIQCLIFVSQLVAFTYQGKQLKRTVDSAENESMPFLFPIIIEHAVGLKSPNNTFPYKPFVNVVFDNYGKTPAIIRSFRGELWLAARLPDEPIYDERTKARTFVAVIPAETRLFSAAPPPYLPTTVAMHDAISQIEWEASRWRVSVGLRFFLVGEVIYDDFFERRHTFGFCIKVIFGGEQWLSGPTKYHYVEHSSAQKKEIEPQDETEA